jgi:pyruvate dehydrogenase E1 component
MTQAPDIDPTESAEWLDALQAVVEHDGPERARDLLERVFDVARLRGLHVYEDLSTPYVNTIPPEAEEPIPGDQEIEHRARSLVRWNSMVLTLRANKESSELGGHIASFQSAATLYEVGQNHFWKGPDHPDGATLSTSRATRRRASTRARSSRDGSPKRR